ncbi:hypothetical protein CU020_0785 [Enterococcus faecium]|nr:hypothetical protein [Enterococcus faecium]
MEQYLFRSLFVLHKKNVTYKMTFAGFFSFYWRDRCLFIRK